MAAINWMLGFAALNPEPKKPGICRAFSCSCNAAVGWVERKRSPTLRCYRLGFVGALAAYRVR